MEEERKKKVSQKNNGNESAREFYRDVSHIRMHTKAEPLKPQSNITNFHYHKNVIATRLKIFMRLKMYVCSGKSTNMTAVSLINPNGIK